jgi:probable phosphoglycerate mutase
MDNGGLLDAPATLAPAVKPMGGSPVIYLARHCRTAFTVENRIQGTMDIPLSEEGRAEAVAHAAKLQPLGIDWIVCSTLKRSHQTGRIYAKQLRAPVYISPRFREMDLGLWEGKTYHELLGDPACRYEQWLEDPASVIVPGSSEQVLAAQQRMIGALRELIFRYPDQSVLIVTHKFIRATLYCALLGVDLGHFRRYIDDGIEPVQISLERIQRLYERD